LARRYPEPPIQYVIWLADFSKKECQEMRNAVKRETNDHSKAWNDDMSDKDIDGLVKSLNRDELPYAKGKKTAVIRRVVVQLRAENKHNKRVAKEKSGGKRKSDGFIIRTDEEVDHEGNKGT
jgi:hypothetical protein